VLSNPVLYALASVLSSAYTKLEDEMGGLRVLLAPLPPLPTLTITNTTMTATVTVDAVSTKAIPDVLPVYIAAVSAMILSEAKTARLALEVVRVTPRSRLVVQALLRSVEDYQSLLEGAGRLAGCAAVRQWAAVVAPALCEEGGGLQWSSMLLATTAALTTLSLVIAALSIGNAHTCTHIYMHTHIHAHTHTHTHTHTEHR
jgi:hypothetical protein